MTIIEVLNDESSSVSFALISNERTLWLNIMKNEVNSLHFQTQ